MNVFLHRRSQTRNHPSKPGDQGFTLIEVMVATAFFLVVLGAILGLQVRAVQMLQSGRNLERATRLLNDMGDLMQVLPAARVQQFVDNKTGTAFSIEGAAAAAGTQEAFFYLFVDMIPSAATFKQLNLQVKWQEKAESRAIFSNLLVDLP